MATEFFDEVAEDASENEEVDENGEEVQKQNGANGEGHFDDSSEEEEDDDDEDARREVAEGFIDDEDDARERRKRKKNKRRRSEEEEGLDDDDLDLIGELGDGAPPETKFKRLKRGHRTDDPSRKPAVKDIFADDYDDEDEGYSRDVVSRNAFVGEFDDFIEQDELDDGAEAEEREVQVGPRKGKVLEALQGIDTGLDEATLEDMRAAFGDGTEYDWALDAQEDEEKVMDWDKNVELKDVFEPSQLVDRMLTDEDNEIRQTDIPERFQLARKPFPSEDLTPEQQSARLREESAWVSSMMWPKKRFDSEMNLQVPFRNAIQQVLVYINEGNLEVPFIFQHRKDYLIHSSTNADPDRETKAEKLLNQTDLWEIFELDLKFRALIQRRQALAKLYDQIKEVTGKPDEIVDEMLDAAQNMEEVQDVQDYINFRYSAEIKDTTVRDVVNGQKRSRAGASIFERVRALPAYSVVRGFGVNPDQFAQSVLDESRRGYTDDPQDRPDDMADQFTDDKDFTTGSQVLKAAKATFVEELVVSPRMRKLLRQTYYMGGRFDCIRTDKGLRQIDEDHPNYEFKYLRNQNLSAIARRPELFLRMLKAEADGLVHVKLRLEDRERFRRRLRQALESDNLSEVADAWNVLRRDALDAALDKLDKVMVRGVKENLKAECENQLARKCRDEYLQKLDQAPYKPKGAELGVPARVLALTNGQGAIAGKNVIHWMWMDSAGNVVQHGTYTDLRLGNPEKGLPDGADVEHFRKLVDRRLPEIIGVSGFSPDTRTLYKDLQAIIDHYDIAVTWDGDDKQTQREKMDVAMINDEVARLYHQSERAKEDFPTMHPLTRYCVALGRYIQSPLKEYAALGRDVLSISFDPDQNLIPKDKLLMHLETAMVDMVNLVGVEINGATGDARIANLLPYVCGLGPRKANAMLQAINRNGGTLRSRAELVGDPENGIHQAVSPHVFNNCASFLRIEFDATEQESNFLDSTRIHPEDYELAGKMAADALDFDEEDIQAEKLAKGEWAVLRQLVQDEAQDKVNDLMLELYADQLEKNFSQRKRATLETIRAELQEPFEELRPPLVLLSHDEIFTMLTGETRDSLCENMVIPVTIRKVFVDHMEVRLDCGIEGGISESDYPTGVMDPRQAFKPHQTIQGKLTFLNRKQLSAQLSLREDALQRPYRKEIDREPGEWDDAQEEMDRRDAKKRTEDATGRAQRVVKHPLFRPFNSSQAEEFLGPQGLGDLVIRPSSKGLDHLTVTWKVSDNVYQHIDVLELGKENEFSVGRTLKVGGRYAYSDLDELIVNHVQAMAKKVREIKNDERYNDGSKAQAEGWLTSYMEANPKRSMYAFCINANYPGYFYLCSKAHANAKILTWSVKVIPNAFEMQKSQYPDMGSLRNGFKTIIMHRQQQHSNGRR